MGYKNDTCDRCGRTFYYDGHEPWCAAIRELEERMEVEITFVGGTVDDTYSSTVETVCHWPQVPRINDKVRISFDDGRELTGWVGGVEWRGSGEVRVYLGGG